MCGTTRSEDAKAAVEMGIDALGFIFFEKSPRNISLDSAADIIRQLPPFVARGGVFVNKRVEQIKEIVDTCGLTHLQLHGEESASMCLDLKRWNPSLSICKAFRVGDDSHDINVEPYKNCVDSILFDTYVKGVKGGTGLHFDWSLIENIPVIAPFILAGGLTADNISSALRLVSPYAIDVNSGVEDEPGVKNHQKLLAFITEVQKADREKELKGDT